MNIPLPKQDPAARQQVLRHISGLSYDKEWSVEIKRGKKRSTSANARYWALLGEIAEAVNLLPEEVHDVCRHMFLGYVEVEIDGKVISILRHTRNLSTDEFTAYMSEVEAWGAVECGVMYAHEVR